MTYIQQSLAGESYSNFMIPYSTVVESLDFDEVGLKRALHMNPFNKVQPQDIKYYNNFDIQMMKIFKENQ